MRGLVFVYIIEEVAQAHAQNAPLVNTWARRCAKAVKRDMLVAYTVIDICFMYCTRPCSYCGSLINAYLIN